MVGDPDIGKSSLLEHFPSNSDLDNAEIGDNYEPTVINFYQGPKVAGEQKSIQTGIFDVGGNARHDHRLQITNTVDVIMLCFAIDNIVSFNNVNFWHKEIINQRPDLPIVLIATKKDLRQPE